MGDSTDKREPRGCRWIEADIKTEDWRYCQQPLKRGSMFCPAHHDRAYFDPKKREQTGQETAE